MEHEKEIARTNYETARLPAELNGQRFGAADDDDVSQSHRRNETNFDVAKIVRLIPSGMRKMKKLKLTCRHLSEFV